MDYVGKEVQNGDNALRILKGIHENAWYEAKGRE